MCEQGLVSQKGNPILRTYTAMFPTHPTFSTLPAALAQPFKRAALGLFHGKTIQHGNNVPHSLKKTRRTWLPNVHAKTLDSTLLGRRVQVKVTARALRTIYKVCFAFCVCVSLGADVHA